MQITKLRLAGFKSFVHPTELAIELGLTGVVGPNGCGKSNLIDALRWVMGETSARGLRGGEMDDVIFAGTAARPAFDLAEVSLRIEAPPLALPGLGDVDELELARRIGRGIGSAFRVNGKELRARDVQLLFADAASGARSAAIVGQGQIGALLDAKPADRRRLIEEAAGVGGLQARRHEAELKLQATEANLVRVQDLLLALEEQHQSLCKQARQAERYRKLSAAFRETEAALLVGRFRLARAELAAAEAGLGEGRADASRQAERLNAARRERERAAAALAEQRAAEAELATELARLAERLGVYDDQAARLDANRARIEERERQIVQDVEHGEASLDDARASGQRLAAERETLALTLGQLSRELDEAANAAAEAEGLATAAEAELRAALAEAAEAEAWLNQLTERRAQAVRDRRGLAAARQDLEARLAAAPARSDRMGAEAAPAQADALARELQEATAAEQAATAALEAADQQREAARAALGAAAARVRETEERRRARQDQEQRRQEQRQRLAERQAELERRRARLGERLAEIDARSAAGSARRAALELPGLEQRLADAARALGAADAALAAAEREAVAARAELEQARQAAQEQKIALERLQTEAAALAQLAGTDAERAGVVDLVRVEEGFAEALAAALGDDLVASLDPAAPSHWRVDLVGTEPRTGEPVPEAPALPAGCRPLAGVVAAPPALARRLAQVGVVEAAAAAALQAHLAQGQRLVSPDGGLWRWDGLVRRPGAREGAAARLRQRTRLRQLETLLAAAGERLGAAEHAARGAAAQAAEADAARQDAALGRETARAAFEQLREGVVQARAAEAALAAELGALAKERAALESEGGELEGAHRLLFAEIDGLPALTAQQPDAGLVALEEARAAEAAAAEQERQAEAAQAGARGALSAARARLAAARENLEHWRTAEQSSAAAERAQELERARLEARLADLEREQAALDGAEAASATALAAAETALTGARARLALAEGAAAAQRHAYAEVGMTHARLRDRLAAARARATSLEQELALWAQRTEAAEARLVELAARRRELAAELERLAELPAAVGRQQAELRARHAEAATRRAALQEQVSAAEAALGVAQAELDRTEGLRVEARETAARLEARLERTAADAAAAETALRARLGAPPDPDQALPSAAELAELEAELARLGAARERLGAVNLRAIDEAAELALRIQTLQAEQAELGGAVERLRRAIATLNREGRERLRAAFGKVETHFEALFTRLFGGGRARLSLTDEDDPLAAGLEIAASPPGKKLQSISLLSGGEKALTALALIFAVFLTNPAPLCLLDEVDAPLDDANVDRLMTLLEELALGTRTRFVVITHHPLTMARMHRLYGVTMAERGISQLVSVDLTRAVELRATA